jgi:hypothetical protein
VFDFRNTVTLIADGFGCHIVDFAFIDKRVLRGRGSQTPERSVVVTPVVSMAPPRWETQELLLDTFRELTPLHNLLQWKEVSLPIHTSMFK